MNSKIEIAEKFTSINGEGRWAGELAVFIRFPGCNLRCSYCDTMWVNEGDCDTFYTTYQEICDYVQESGAKHVTVTGGEPLLNDCVLELFKCLHGIGVQVEVETNGSVDLVPFIKETPYVSFTMDYKMPTSGMESKMKKSNLFALRPIDTLKMVCGKSDLNTIPTVIEGVCHETVIFMSPVFGSIEPKEMVDYVMEQKLSRVKIQLQIHKFIWPPEARGV